MPPEPAAGSWVDAGWLDTAVAAATWRRGADRVPFGHPAWLSTWWRVHRTEDAEVRVWVDAGADAGVHDADAVSPGAPAPRAFAAWLLQERRVAGGLRVRRLQPLGQSAWLHDAFPGEYGVLAGDVDAAVAARALRAALQLEWDEMLAQHVVAGAALSRALATWSAEAACRAEVVGASAAWRIPTTGTLAAHRARLSDGERRALYSRTARERVEYAVDGGALRDLYRLHDLRWAGRGMPARVRRFLDELAAALPPEDVSVRVSLLRHAGTPCSARLLLDCARATYDLQSGFAPSAVRGASLGKLHLGCELARAFADPGTDAFDLLAGQGMHADYKARLAADAVPLEDVRVVRSRWLRAIGQLRRCRSALRGRFSGAASVRSPRSRAPRRPRGDSPR